MLKCFCNNFAELLFYTGVGCNITAALNAHSQNVVFLLRLAESQIVFSELLLLFGSRNAFVPLVTSAAEI